jgi:hypothetical protein
VSRSQQRRHSCRQTLISHSNSTWWQPPTGHCSRSSPQVPAATARMMCMRMAANGRECQQDSVTTDGNSALECATTSETPSSNSSSSAAALHACCDWRYWSRCRSGEMSAVPRNRIGEQRCTCEAWKKRQHQQASRSGDAAVQCCDWRLQTALIESTCTFQLCKGFSCTPSSATGSGGVTVVPPITARSALSIAGLSNTGLSLPASSRRAV